MPETVLVEKTCPVCKKFVGREMDLDCLSRYFSGHPIYAAFPLLSPIEREFVQTGICSDECWDSLFGAEA